ncbi:MAG TPA: hypothetical protein VNE39_12385 [Planctomycetota bacterium]|nr:hypothetical protein [Planctomycetota bacterium]
MSTTQASTSAEASREAAPHVNLWLGLLWREWLARRGLVVGALAVWLAGGWVILLFYHPGWIIAFGVFYAFLAGPSFGGSEVIEGSEEFSFSLPPPRGDRYLVRMAFGGATVLAFTTAGVLAIGLDLPQRVWGLFVNSGFTEPFPPAEIGFLYPLAVALPFAVFAFSFAIAAVAATRGTVLASPFVGGILAAGTMGAGLLCERYLWNVVNGYISVTALFAAAPLALLWGYLAYQRKEGINRPAPMAGGPCGGRGRL